MARDLAPRAAALLLVAATLGFAEGLPSRILDRAPRHVKGHFGEQVVDDLYAGAGRRSLLDKALPTADGPDRLYRLPDGAVEIHEVKANGQWPTRAGLGTEVGGARMDQLSDRWIREWIDRVRLSPTATAQEKAAAAAVEQAMRDGKLIRILDGIHMPEGKFRSWNVIPDGDRGVILRERAGPMDIDRFREKWELAKKRLQGMPDPKGAERILRRPAPARVHEAPKSWGEVHAIGKERFPTAKVAAGLITRDGKLVVGLRSGATAGLLVFAFEGGEALYQYHAGNCYAPEVERRIQDAAIKGAAVAGATAVAVFLGASPAGWVVLGIGAGAYWAADQIVTAWRERQDAAFLDRSDLEPFGIRLDSVLDLKPAAVAHPR